ncbi:hypothetical protein GCM10009838_89220 [Catenulispora subtropica]|uniref:Uncharacterized protein n=1 Tax=Catenulispora subtropica TaxID=450798 RepID=A0ABN2THM0_9ACTN
MSVATMISNTTKICQIIGSGETSILTLLFRAVAEMTSGKVKAEKAGVNG